MNAKLGNDRFWNLYNNVTQLEYHQKRWKSMGRVESGIAHQLKTGKLTEEYAQWYTKHHLFWYAREAKRVTAKAGEELVSKVADIYRELDKIDVGDVAKKTWCFMTNDDYRRQAIIKYATRQVKEFEQRKEFAHDKSDYLTSQLNNEAFSPYIPDFVAAFTMLVIEEGIVLPSLAASYLLGFLDFLSSAAIFWSKGFILRTGYTGSRIIYDYAKSAVSKSDKKRLNRWVALGVGMIPKAGHAAYPAQLYYSGVGGIMDAGAFLLYNIQQNSRFNCQG